MSNKGGYNEMNGIHMAGMKPLTELIDANKNFHNLEKMIASKNNAIPVPDFRHAALEEEFCKKLTGVCDIFKEYGTDKLEDIYDIKQMLKIKNLPGWEQCVPFRYIVTPLDNAITKVRNDLLDMDKKGNLFTKYIVEDNVDLKKDVIHMIK